MASSYMSSSEDDEDEEEVPTSKATMFMDETRITNDDDDDKENPPTTKPSKEIVTVERRIRDLIQTLSNFIGDISKETKVSEYKMENHANALQKCLADIEHGLTEQLNSMEESLMSSEFNCAPSIYDYQIKTMDEMYEMIVKVFHNALHKVDNQQQLLDQ